ncbi:type II toxin-antitoxin system RelE/ParE family toxin [Anaerostipes sp.]|uniref:type II toxin-antitoxin system RelE/ParE family toxin n=1 Tax=Anaerostipes sp. TaxID=1872530 RepID=UPI0025B8E66C|nr:type II toxin-antitoxin system RelE/ParE family toxin [Anaerostipes sp.]MBS7009097.1 type II toxin-antitoxin system RelE/ParE family toxin [Anaerostipes sp.]
MKIYYDNKNIQKLCNDYRHAQIKLGKNVADKLHKTLQFIDASVFLMDIKNMKTFRLHPLRGDRKGTYAIDLGKRTGFRLILIPVGPDGNEWTTENDIVIYNSTVTVILLEVSKHYE